MILKELLSNRETHVTYRTFGPNGEDLLHGFAFWDGRELFSQDNDDYSVNDEIDVYVWTSHSDLVVWYKSRWIEGCKD